MAPKIVADPRCTLGENPLWHPDDHRLYWTDIPNGHLFRYDPITQEYEQCYDGPIVGGFTIQNDGSLLLFGDNGAVRRWNDGDVETVIHADSEAHPARFNDVIADPEGRVFCGSMPTDGNSGRLYRLEIDGRLNELMRGYQNPNGLGFTLNRQELYFSDSKARTVYRFDYDQETGEISHRKTFISVPESEGEPDGLTVDSEGFVWSARWNDGCIIRHGPDGTPVSRFEFPARKVTSLTFGGDDQCDLYVTTAGGDNRETEGVSAGALFKIVPGITGLPEFRSRIEI